MKRCTLFASPVVAAWLALTHQVSAADPYEQYVRTSEDFRAVKQEKAWALRAFPNWTYMPWTHQWGIGYKDRKSVV